MKTTTILTIIFFIITNQSYSLDLTWTGNVSNDWGDSSNFSPAYVPGAYDTVTIDSQATHDPELVGDVFIYRLEISGGHLYLNSYELNVNNEAVFSGGVVENGRLVLRGILAEFAGTVFDAELDVICDKIFLNGSMFHQECYFETRSDQDIESDGGNLFHAQVALVHGGAGALQLASISGDEFNANLQIINQSERGIYLSMSASSIYHNIVLSNTEGGVIRFGANGGTSTMIFESELSIVTSDHFTQGVFGLSNVTHEGGNILELELTGSAMLVLDNCVFEGPVIFMAPDILYKNCTFNEHTTLLKKGGYNNTCDGNNTFHSTAMITNLSDTYSLVLSNTMGNFYYGSVYYESSGGGISTRSKADQPDYYHGDITTTGSGIYLSNAIMSGNNNQELAGSSHLYGKIELAKPTGAVYALTPVEVEKTFKFTSGILHTDTVNQLTFKAGSNALDASNTSFVSGPVKKVGNTAFEFPVGEIDAFLPISISAPQNTTDDYTAQLYFSRQLLGNDKEGSLDYLSEYSHWKLQHNTGSSKVKIKLHWDNRYTPVIDTSRLRIAHWYNDEWIDLGHGSITGNYSEGNMTSVDSIDSFGYFIYAYSENTNEMTNRGLGFIRNDGQVINSDTVQSPEVLFYSNDGDTRQYFKNDTIMHVLAITHHYPDILPDSLYRVDMVLLNGSNSSSPIGVEPNSSYLNFILGYIPAPVVEVPNYKKVVYESAFDEIDLIISKENGIRYDFVLHPGASVDSIKFKYEGATSITELDNQLFISTPLGDLVYDVPEAWYDSAGVIVPVEVSYRINGQDTVTFELGNYNPEFTIIVGNFSPRFPLPNNSFGHLYWSTFVEYNVHITDVFYKEADNTVYIIGENSTGVSFPVAIGTIYPTPIGGLDALIVKFNANRIDEWYTYYGGSYHEFDNRIWITPDETIVFAGGTGSGDLPLEPCGGCHSQGFNGIPEIYIVKLDELGGFAVNYAMYFGGVGGGEFLNCITGDMDGNIYLGGYNSNEISVSTFPVVDLSAQAFLQDFTYMGTEDPFVAKFNAANQLVWSTSLGGYNATGHEEVTGMCTDKKGNLFVIGTIAAEGTDSPYNSAPLSTNPHNGLFPLVSPGGSAFVEGKKDILYSDIFLMKFDAQNKIHWSTMIGGSNDEANHVSLIPPFFNYSEKNNKGIIVSSSGEIFAIGSTKSDDINFLVDPATTGSYFQGNHGGEYDALLLKFSKDFELLYATYYGGTDNDIGLGVTIDSYGNVYYVGSTETSDIATDPFPLMPPYSGSPGAEIYYQDVKSSGYDGFLVKMTKTLRRTLSTYFGGDGNDAIRDITSNSAGNNIVFTGYTHSSSPTFPLSDPGGASYFSSAFPGISGGFISNMVNVCTGCRVMNETISNQIFNYDFNLFPNPASTIINLDLQEFEGSINVIIFDSMGKLVFHKVLNGDNYQILDVSNFKSGIYLVRVENDNRSFVKRFIVQH